MQLTLLTDSDRRGARVLGLLAALLAVALPCRALGQPAGTAVAPATQPAASQPATAQPSPDLARLEAQVEAQSQRLKELEEKLEAAQEEPLPTASRPLDIYGFAALGVTKVFMPDNGVLKGFVPDNTNFSFFGLNLYLARQLSSSVRFLGEVSFSTLPNGALQFEGLEVTRQDTNMMDPYTANFARLGGVAVQRALVEYTYSDHLKITAGTYLTPYGFWNVDHGTTVILTAHQPYLVLRDFLPNRQTGLQVGGRLDLHDSLALEYGATLSNGRGPLDDYADLDANRGLGARLALIYEGPLKLEVIGYLYHGDYTTTEFAWRNPVYLQIDETPVVSYRQTTLALAARLDYGPVRLQSEFLRGSVEYQDGHRAMNILGTAMLPDHIQQSWYVLLSSRVPFPQGELRPYVMVDTFEDYEEITSAYFFTGGLNWRVITPVVLKLEGSRAFYHRLPSDTVDRGFWVLSTQLAVAF